MSATSPSLVEGTVLDGGRGQYRVQTADVTLICDLRGKLRKDLLYAISPSWRHKARRANVKARDPLAVGDRVRVLPTGGGRGMIEEIVPRAAGAFTREADVGLTTSVAGIDQIVAVFAVRDPEPHLGLLDRLLVMAEAQEISAIVCLNKADLGADAVLLERSDMYRSLGYTVVLTSAANGLGLDELRGRLAGRTSALLGPSGVGKSSLLNALEPGLALRVAEISDSTGKGRHTTTGTRVVPLAGGGFVADTAGIKTLGLGRAGAGQLDWCFRELRPYLGRCQHNDCGHRHEPGCAIRAAAAAGEVDQTRYDSYCRLYDQGAAQGGRAWRDLTSSRSLVGEGEFRL